MINACVLVKTVPTRSDDILGALKGIEGIRKTYIAYGRFDIVAFLEVEDYKSLRQVTAKINNIDDVRSTETLAEA